jgi:hypothetical protein
MNQLDRVSEDSLGFTVDRVVIGMDPHKRSATIEVMTGDETIVGTGRFGTGREGYAEMTTYAKQWPNRVWAIEGCQGIGRHIATRLLADGEQVVDVPPKLSARARVFATGQGRKTDATDAHSVALVGTRMTGLRPLVNDEQLAVLRILVDRRPSSGTDASTLYSPVVRRGRVDRPNSRTNPTPPPFGTRICGASRYRSRTSRPRSTATVSVSPQKLSIYDTTTAASRAAKANR